MRYCEGLKEKYQFNISVEGEVCEYLYFLHIAKLINASPDARYKVNIICKKASPHDFVRRNQCIYTNKKGKYLIPYIHIQDIEDYQDENQQTKFKALLDEIRNTEKEHRVTYQLGYSNYTFELWMLLHVADMKYAVLNRDGYLKPINKYFKRKYNDIDKYKRRTEFQGILDEFITLESIFTAIKHAEEISIKNCTEGKKQESYKKFSFYFDNPDTSIHEIVKLIFNTCEVKNYKS